MSRAGHLRLVPKAPPPRPRHLEVRIIAADGRKPHGRSRAFLLTLDELFELIAHIEMIEERA
jgi:hypothetical protein